MEAAQVAHLLNNTFSSDGDIVRAATDDLDRLSQLPNFRFFLLSIATGGENQGQKVAAATYLKNFTRRNIDADGSGSNVSKEFRDTLVRALLQVEPAILKLLVEVFRLIVTAEFVKENLWPELVPQLRAVIQESCMDNGNSEWKTINTLTVLQSLIRPFQYFLNPKVAKEQVPPQLEQITHEILVPLLAVFHCNVEKAFGDNRKTEVDTEQSFLIICKCIYFAVRSHMPSALAPMLPSLCHDFFAILNSLKFDEEESLEDGYSIRLKTGKRILLIFSALVTRHRKYSDRLMPDIIGCVTKIVKYSPNIKKLDFLSERVISLAFDVISRVLETGPGWKLVSPHFSSLLDYAIFPALIINEKDILEWEEDADEYIRKNLPSDLEEISGLREDLFTPRKSALNLLGVISMSKGPPIAASKSSKRKKGEKTKRKDQSSMGDLLVFPFLSKYPVPADANASVPKISNDYSGVLMAYGSLQDFLSEKKAGYSEVLIRNRILPLYKTSTCHPYLLASANWVLGQLVSCIPEEMSADIYSSLMKALTMRDVGDISCYPVRVSAAGAIAELVQNEYFPPDWLPLLQDVVSRIGEEDEEENPILFELLGTLVEADSDKIAPHIPHIVSLLVATISKYIPPSPEPWLQMVERGFAALSVIAQCWENYSSEEVEKEKSSELWVSGQSTISRDFSHLLQQAWLTPSQMLEDESETTSSPSPSCINDSSTLLRFIMQCAIESNIVDLKVSELLLVWSDLISDWHAWEESEDLSIFNCIKEAVDLHTKSPLKNFITSDLVQQHSIIEGIRAFISEAFSQYPSAISRAASCVHLLLHVPTYSSQADGVKQSLVISFSRAAFSGFREIRSTPSSLWKPFLLTISSCYLCYPDIVEKVLEEEQHEGFLIWASSLASISTSKFEHGLSTEPEFKLSVMVLSNVVERLVRLQSEGNCLLWDCFAALLEASVRLKEVQEEDDNDEDDEEEEEEEEDDDEEDDDDEDSSEDEREETEEEFLKRCAETAAALENGTSVLEDVDSEDEEEDDDIALGNLEEIDEEGVVLSLLAGHHKVLTQTMPSSVSPQLISSFLNTFPNLTFYFPNV